MQNPVVTALALVILYLAQNGVNVNLPTPTQPPVQATNPSPAVQSAFDSTYVYPNSETITSSVNQITLTSPDDPEKITDWYKDKIQNLGFGAKSTTRTNTNGQILNKISAASASQEVNIEIAKSPGDPTTTITVNID